MARLRDVSGVLKTVGVFGFSHRVWGQIIEDDLFTWASALAYSWLFAVFPFLIFLLTFLPYLPVSAQERAKDEVRELVYRVVPSDKAADDVWNNVDHNLSNLLYEKQIRILPRLLGLGLALWAASGGMAATMSALDQCYEIPKGRPIYLHRLWAVGLTLIVAVLMILVVSLLPVGTLVKHLVEGRWLRQNHPLLMIFDIVRWTLALFFMISVVAIVYYKGPSIRHRFSWLTPGAAFSIFVWLGLGLLFRLYVAKFGQFDRTYGAVGGVAVLLLCFYLDALVLLIGAEINSEIDFEVLKCRRGTRDFVKAEEMMGQAVPTGI